MSTIYQDDKRTITRDSGMITIRSARGEREISLASETRSPDPKEVAALCKAGQDPTGWFVVCTPVYRDRRGTFGGSPLALCPPELRPVIEAAQQDHAAAQAAEEARRLTDPEEIAWERIMAAREAIEHARRAIDSPRYSDTGREYVDLAESEQGLKDARAAYLAAFGEQGKHWAEAARERAAEKARREDDFRNSFIGRGID